MKYNPNGHRIVRKHEKSKPRVGKLLGLYNFGGKGACTPSKFQKNIGTYIISEGPLP